MKKCNLFLVLAFLLALPALPASAAGADEIIDDFSSYQTYADIYKAWPASNEKTNGGGSIKTIAGQDISGSQSKLLSILTAATPGGEYDPYIQSGMVNMQGDKISYFELKPMDQDITKKLVWREQVGSSAAWTNVFEAANGQIKCFDTVVNDPATGQPYSFATGEWMSVAIETSIGEADASIVYKVHINGREVATGTKAKASGAKYSDLAVRFGLGAASGKPSEMLLDNVVICSQSKINTGLVTSTPEDGAKDTKIQNNTVTVNVGGIPGKDVQLTPETITVTKEFEGEATPVTDYTVSRFPLGFSVIIGNGPLDKATKYTVAFGMMQDYKNQLLTSGGSVSFTTEDEIYVPEYMEKIVGFQDFSEFSGSEGSMDMGGGVSMTFTKNSGTVAVEDVGEPYGKTAVLGTASSVGNAGPFAAMNFDALIKGKVYMQADVKMTCTDHGLKIFTIKDPNGKWNTDVAFTSSGNIDIIDAGSKSIKTVMPYAKDTWYTILEVIDLEAKTFDLYINGQLTAITGQPLANPTITGIPNSRITHESSVATNGKAYIDNFKVYTLNEAPGVMATKFRNGAGLYKTGIAPTDTNQIAIKFSVPMSENKMNTENITLGKTLFNTPVSYAGSYDKAERTYYMDLSQPLQPSVNYVITFGGAVQSEADNMPLNSSKLIFPVSFETFGAKQIAFLSGDAEIKKLDASLLGQQVTAKATVVNQGTEAQNATVILAYYADGIMKKAVVKSVSVDPGDSAEIITKAVTLDQIDNIQLKAFVWNNLADKRMVAEEKVLER